MSQENVELARRGYTAFRALLERATAGEDISDAPEWEVWDEDVVIVEIADYPDTGTYRGHEGMRRWLRGYLEAFDEISVEPLEFIAAGDYVVVPTHQRARSKAGVDVEQRITQVLRFRGGKVVYATGYRDKSKALEAAGLSERDAHAQPSISQDNVNIVRAAYRAWNAGDMDGLRELFDPEAIIVRMPEGWPEPGPFVGREAIMREIGQWRETFGTYETELVGDIIEAADRVVVRQVWHGVGQGPESHLESTVIYTLRKGRVFLMEYFWDHTEALETLGLSEKDAYAESS